VLRAPYDGVVGNLAVQTGDLVSAGARLAALVPTKALYVDANFKETQLARLVPGETVTIRVDAMDGPPITGTVESLAPASGSVFSLLPAENATGNFTKVVQRVPVRIALPADVLASGTLKAGLSVVVEADTRTAPQG
jgi:membrane fusion protein (multidrug efflux system)